MNTVERHGAIMRALSWGFAPINKWSRASKHDAGTTLQGFAAAVSWLSKTILGAELDVTPADLDRYGYQYFRDEHGETVRVRLNQRRLGEVNSDPLRAILATPPKPEPAQPPEREIEEGHSPRNECPSDQTNHTETDNSAMLTQVQPTLQPQQAAPGVDPQTWIQAAQRYAQLGFAVLPLNGKVPLTARGVLDASRDPAQWASWVGQFPGANIGVAIPDGVAVIDVDPRNGGAATFDQLDDVEGAIPKSTLQVQTGGGGLHVFTHVPPGYQLPSKLGPGVDVKQLGGYVVAAPSIHPQTGQAYRIGDWSTIAPAPAPLRARLVPRGESRAKAVALDEIDDARRDAAGWGLDPELVVQDVSPEQIAAAVAAVAPVYTDGQRHAVRVALGGILARRGWSAASVEDCINQLARATGGDTSHKVVRECLAGMNYPGGYHRLAELVDAATLEAIDARIANPYGVHLRESRTAAANDVMSRLAKIEAQRAAANPSNDTEDDEFFGTLAARSNGPAPLQLVAGLDITDGRTTGLAGLAHAGKTPLAMRLALSIANGKDWLGRETQKRPVVYVNFEKGFDAISKRERLASGMEVDPESMYLLNFGDKGMFLNDKADSLTKLVAIVKHVHAKTHQAPLIMVDTLANSVAGVDHNVAAYAEPLRTLLVAARQVAPCAAVVLLHCRKSLAANMRPTLNDVEGSGQIVGLCDAVIGLHKPDPIDGNKVTVSGIRTLAEELPPIEIEWSGGKDEPLVCRELNEAARSERKRRPKAESKTERKSRAYRDLSNAIESATAAQAWDREQLRAAAKCSGKDAQTNEAFEYASKQLIKDGKLRSWAGSRGAQHFQRVAPAEVLAERGAARRSADIHTHNETLIAQAVNGLPGHPPPLSFGGFGPQPPQPKPPTSSY